MNSTSSDQLSTLTSTLNLLLSKIGLMIECAQQKTHAVNVYNSSCHHNIPRADKGCQTSSFTASPSPEQELSAAKSKGASASNTPVYTVVNESFEAILTCTMCEETFESNTELDNHIESSHSGVKCDFCEQTFSCNLKLQKHKNEKHPAAYIQCKHCMLRFQDSRQLEHHVHTQHKSHTDPASTDSLIKSTEASKNISMISQSSSL